MSEAFRAFMKGMIDYAGLFPPARLDLDTAFRNYVRLLEEPEAWMLNRFILPAEKLKALSPLQDEYASGRDKPFRYSILLKGGARAKEALDAVREGVEEMLAFLDRRGSAAMLESAETRLPLELAEGARPETVMEYVRSLDAVFFGSGLRGIELFIEIPGEVLTPRTVEPMIQGIGDAARGGGRDWEGLARAGFKLRCGGVEAGAIPKPDLAANVISACRALSVPLKCTAGLHHPMRHRDENLDVMAHGFLNVFGAGILAHALNLPFERIGECLCDKDPAHFRFQGDLFAWRDIGVPASEVAEARAELMIGFGSCSFDEPREDLRRLGLLPAE
jgi:hypothetical protein